MSSHLLGAVLATCLCASALGQDLIWSDWQEGTNLWQSTLGGQPQPLTTGTFSNPLGLGIDRHAQRLFVADAGGVDGIGSAPGITSMNLDGSNQAVIITGGSPTDVAVDPAGSRIFWTDNGGPVNIWTAESDGRNPIPLLSGAFSNPVGLDSDPLGEFLYVADAGAFEGGSAASIARVSVINGAVDVLATGGRPTAVAVDALGGFLYWTDAEGPVNVWRAHLDGSNPTPLLMGSLSNPTGIALDLNSHKIILTDEGGESGLGSVPSVSWMNLDGTGFEILWTGGRPTDIVVVPAPASAALVFLTGVLVGRRRR